MRGTIACERLVPEARSAIRRQGMAISEKRKAKGPSREPMLLILLTLSITFLFPLLLRAEDSPMSRRTLTGIQAVSVVVEELQPSIQKYAAKFGLTKAIIQSEVEKSLLNSGIHVVSGNEWLNTPGRPVLYLNVNTHETEKYWYAYDIKIELRQIVHMETNPRVKILSDTWSISMTGIANIGTLNVIRHDVGVLVGKFIQAYKAANRSK